MNKLLLSASLLLSSMLLSSIAFASSAHIGIGAGFGDDDSTAFTLHLRQTYEPWITNEIGEIAPTVEIGATMWLHDDDDTNWGAYAAPGVKVNLFTDSVIQPYLAGTLGGAVVSDDKFGDRDLGSHVLFRTQGAVGVQFGDDLRHQVQGEYTHYSNWGLADTNDGYSTYGLSYGYSF